VVAGTSDAVLMVESEAKELPEDVMLGAVMFGHKEMQPVIEMIIQLAEVAAKDPRDLPVEDKSDLYSRVKELAAPALRAAYAEPAKAVRHEKIESARDALLAAFTEDQADAQTLNNLFKKVESDIVRNSILDTGLRIDGRDVKTVRPITCEVGLLPRTHGSAL